jgi:hypothetical protein
MSRETPAFIDALKSMVNKLASEKDLSDAQVTAEDIAYFKEKMLEVKTACETLQKKAAKTAMNDLKAKEWPKRISHVLDELSVHLLHSDFEKAAAIAAEAVAAENGEPPPGPV